MSEEERTLAHVRASCGLKGGGLKVIDGEGDNYCRNSFWRNKARVN